MRRRLIDALLRQFPARRADARKLALQYRVLILESNSVPVDIALGAMPFEERAVARASAWTLADGTAIRTCSAEDLVVFKVFAARDQDWLAIHCVALRQAGRLDAELIIEELAPLLDLKGATEDLARMERLVASARTPE